MARQFRFQMKRQELSKLLKTEGLVASRKVADQVLAIVGTQHYEIEEWVGKNRGRVTVRTKDNFKSRGHEAKWHKLVLALGQVGTGSSRPDAAKVRYVSKSGNVSMVTQAQADNYARNSRG